MRRSIAMGTAMAAMAALAWRYLPRHAPAQNGAGRGGGLSGAMMRHLGRMLAHMPDNAPPKLVMSVLPRLQAQNEQIIAMLREQNELLRRQQGKVETAEVSDHLHG